VKEGAAADAAVQDAAKKTTSRREMSSRHQRFEQISPEVGELDESAFDEALADDPDETLALLADLTAATDPKLRELARRLAGRLLLDLSRRGRVRPRGIGKIESQRYRPDGGDLDIDASIEPIAEARATGGALDVERVRVRGWVKPGTALCLLVDRSGSMGCKPLAVSAIAAAAVAWRSPEDYSVLAFGKDVVVAKSQDAPKPGERVVNDVLSLRGFGTTDLAGALQTASAQLARSRAGRRVAVLLSDCRATVPGDVVGAARALDELCIVAPAGDDDAARELGAQIGARVVSISGPAELPDALAQVLGD
jgi:VWA domain containing CoxE-like protein